MACMLGYALGEIIGSNQLPVGHIMLGKEGNLYFLGFSSFMVSWWRQDLFHFWACFACG